MKRLLLSFIFTIAFVSPVFAYLDLPSSHWSYEYVTFLGEMGVLDTRKIAFQPDDKVSRAELMKMVIEASGSISADIPQSSAFSDIPTDSWFFPYVETAFRKGIIEGYKDTNSNLTGIFGPHDPVSRAAATKILINAFKIQSYNKFEPPFSDINKSDWFHAYVTTAYNWTIVDGKDDRFDPSRAVTRAEAAKMISNAMMPIDRANHKSQITNSSLRSSTYAFQATEDKSSFGRQAKQISNFKPQSPKDFPPPPSSLLQTPSSSKYTIHSQLNVPILFTHRTPYGFDMPHTIEAIAVDDKLKRVQFEIQPENYSFWLAVPISKEFDLNLDNYADLKVTLHSWSGDNFDLSIESPHKGTEYQNYLKQYLKSNAKYCETFQSIQNADLSVENYFDGNQDNHADSFELKNVYGEIIYQITYDKLRKTQSKVTKFGKDRSKIEYTNSDPDIFHDLLVQTRPNGKEESQITNTFAYFDSIDGEFIEARLFRTLQAESTLYDSEGRTILIPQKMEFPSQFRRYDSNGILRQSSKLQDQSWNTVFYDQNGNTTGDPWLAAYEKMNQALPNIEISFGEMLKQFDPDSDGKMRNGETFDFRILCKNQPQWQGLGQFEVIGNIDIDENGISGTSAKAKSGLMWFPPDGYRAGNGKGLDFEPEDSERGYIQIETRKRENYDFELIGDENPFIQRDFLMNADIESIKLIFGENGGLFRSVMLNSSI